MVTSRKTGFVEASKRGGFPDVVVNKQLGLRAHIDYDGATIESTDPNNPEHGVLVIPLRFDDGTTSPMVFQFRGEFVTYEGLRVGQPSG